MLDHDAFVRACCGPVEEKRIGWDRLVSAADRYDEYLEHPADEPRFAGRIAEYPGGWPAFWRDFRATLTAYVRDTADLSWASGPGPAEYIAEQVHSMLRRKVRAAAEKVAAQAGVSERNMSHWLVKAKGFPWRRDCTFEQLRDLLSFLERPEAVGEARTAPNYPDRTRPSEGNR